MTASDPDSSGQQSSNSNEQKRMSRPSDETKSNTDESKSFGALSGGAGSGNAKKTEFTAAGVMQEFAAECEAKPRNKTQTDPKEMGG